jgi:hypothetical protein
MARHNSKQNEKSLVGLTPGHVFLSLLLRPAKFRYLKLKTTDVDEMR